jgi:ABC-type glycerol-3-phosphate transport system substrate-binding protein
VNTFSQNQDLAAAYAEWWASLDIARQIGTDFGTLPVRRSLLAETGSTPAAAAYAAAAEQYGHPVNRFPSPFYTPVAEVVDVVLHAIVDGSLDAQAALDKMTADAQAKMDEYYAR